MPDRSPLLPMVSIHVPICNEPPDRVRSALASLADLDYPAYEVLVVDHNTPDPELWEPVARECARRGARFRFFHLGTWPAGRAGALNFARVQATDRAEVVAVLEPDALVARNWLQDAVPEFADPRVGVVRSPCLLRKAALDGVGGWAEWTVAEDAALDLALSQARWLSAEPAPPVEPGPADFADARQRTARRAYGAAQIGRRHWLLLPLFDRTLAWPQRWRVVAGWLPWMGDALGLLLLWVNLALSFGLMMAPERFDVWRMLCGVLAAGLLAGKLARLRGAGFGAILTGLALSHTGGRAFWNGILGKGVPCQDGAYPELAPARTGSLRSEELAMLLAIWASLAGVAAMHNASWQAAVWCAALLVQSVPYLVAFFLAWQPVLAARRREARRLGVGGVARSGSGD
jgi:cellulose synthase/poly-beta-1,6-N-acetylglucosamine synthase-like glycosyltransferase